jgi:hypothetical protein
LGAVFFNCGLWLWILLVGRKGEGEIGEGWWWGNGGFFNFEL